MSRVPSLRIALRTPLPPHLAPEFAYDSNEWKDWYADKTRPELIVVNSGELDGMGGVWGHERKGRRLAVPSTGTRPTSDRAREALFSALESALLGRGGLGTRCAGRGGTDIAQCGGGKLRRQAARHRAFGLQLTRDRQGQ